MWISKKYHKAAAGMLVTCVLFAGSSVVTRKAEAMAYYPACSGTRGNVCEENKICTTIIGTDISICTTTFYYQRP